MGLVELMSSEAVSPSGRPLRAAVKPKAGGSLSAGDLSRSSTGGNDAYIAQIIMKDQDRQEKQAGSEMRRLGVELREVSPAPASQRRADARVRVRWAEVAFLLGCGINNANPAQMWLAKARQEEYDKKEARLGVIDKRQRSQTNVRVREREYRKSRCDAASISLRYQCPCGAQAISDRWDGAI